MKHRNWIVVLSAALLALCLGTTAQAAPGCPQPITVTQPTGEKLRINQSGDEHFHWAQTSDGAVVLQDDAGAWHYAAWQEGAVTPLPQQAGIDARPEGAATAGQMQAAWTMDLRQHPRMNAQRAPGASAATVNLKTKGPQKLLVLLVNFTDVRIAYGDNLWSTRVFGNSNPNKPISDTNGSVNGLYKETSGGAFWFAPAAESAGTANDGVIRVTLPMVHPDFPNYTDSAYNNPEAVFEANSHAVAVAALQAADASIDFDQFDSNGDGAVQPSELHLVIVMAGYENAYTSMKPNVWAHTDGLSSLLAPQLDGVQVGLTYCEQGERLSLNRIMTIGVTAHELGHSLGLPDLYDTSGMSEGVGMHSLMGGGSWGNLTGSTPGSSPTHMDAWSRMMLGWGKISTQGRGNTTLHSSASAYNIVKVPTTRSGEYFLLENRQFTGYDKALAGACKSGGVAIWHVDESVLDTCTAIYGGWYNIQSNADHKAVDLEESSEGTLGYSQLDEGYTTPAAAAAYDSYFYAGSQSRFNSTTKPSSNLYSGKASGAQVKVLSASSPAMNLSLDPPAKLSFDSLSEPGSPVLAGAKVRWTCKASSTQNIKFSYAVLDAAGKVVAKAAASAANSFDWRPSKAGSYRLQVTASNGDSSVVKVSAVLVVKANPHTPVLLANKGKLANGKASRYSVSVTATDADAGDHLTLTCTRNGASITWPAKGVFGSDGVYVITATDLAGHSATLRFAIDRNKPSILAKKEDGSTLQTGSLVNRAVTVTITDTTLASRKVTRNGRTYAWPAGGVFAANGTYTVTARDKLGNSSTLRFTIDHSAPVIRVRSGKSTLTDGQTAKSVTVTVSDSALRSKSITKNGAAMRWPSGGRIRAAGVYHVRAVDRAGNVSTFTFTIKP